MSNTPNRKSRRPPVTSTPASSNRWIVWAVLGVIAVVAVIAVVVVAAGGSSDDGTAAKGKPAKFETAPELTVDGTTLPRFETGSRDTAIGMTAPTIDTVDFSGAPIQAGGATGSPYALVFLAHWCPHCQAEVPRLVDLAQGGKIAGVDVIGVPTGTTDQAPNYPPSSWLAREDWPFPVALDTTKTKGAQAFGLSGYPYFVFVDAQGKVVGRTSGEIEPDQLEGIFQALAKGQTLPLPGAGASSSTR